MFILNKIDITDVNNLVYFSHQNVVSIDESWFYTDLSRKSLEYLPDHEYHLNNFTQHKSHIPQLMITAAISEPSDTFDGKVGMLFHGEVILARRNSFRRPAGTPEIHPIVVYSTEFYNSQTKIHHDLEKTGILDMIERVINP